MYLVRGIPLKRAIPGGELSYISRTNVPAGSVLRVPVKKSFEFILVTSCNSVHEEKEYIKSLPFKLVTLSEIEIVTEYKKNILKAFESHALYSLASMDKIVRAFFSKSNFKPTACTDIVLVNNKKFTKNANEIEFHNFINLFLVDSKKVDFITIQNPTQLSVYGVHYLGFDPIPFFVLLKKHFKFELFFNSQYKRLSYEEWDVSFKKKDSVKPADIFIHNRSEENKTQKSEPITKDFVKVITKNLNNKILVLGSAKNFATRTKCSDCGTLHTCSTCSKPFVLVKNSHNYAKKHGIAGEYIYICTNCKTAENSIVKCRNCDSWDMLPLGFGIERIHEYIASFVRGDKLYDFSERIGIKDLAKWRESGGVIIGPLSTIHSIEDANIVIVPSVAGLLYGDVFDSAERARDILEYTGGTNTRIYISVMQDEEKLFLEKSYTEWKKDEKKDRQDLHYPPYARYVEIVCDAYASKSPKIIGALQSVAEKYALANTVSTKTNSIGIVTISFSASDENWSIVKNKYNLPEKLDYELTRFREYLTARIY